MPAPVIYFDFDETLVFGPEDNKQPFDDAADTIEALYRGGYKIGLLADFGPGTTVAAAEYTLVTMGLGAFFDVVTISSEFEPPVDLPGAALFEKALEKAGHTSASADTIFVSANLSHVEAARALGWRSIHKPYLASCTAASGECVEDLDSLLGLFPELTVDLYIRDAEGDQGDDDTEGMAFWNSPDLWIRHQADFQTTHQPPLANQPNYFFSRVHNRGSGIARFFAVCFTVPEWAGTEFIYPDDYDLPYEAIAYGAHLEPGDSAIIFAKWEADDVPPAGTYVCLLAATYVASGCPRDPNVMGAHVWQHNNLAQKNLTILEGPAGGSGLMSLVFGSRNIDKARYCTIELYRPENALEMPVSIVGNSGRAMDKLVQAGQAFVHEQPPLTATPQPTGLRFLDGGRIELIGAEAATEKLTMELAAGSVLNWGGPAQPKTASTARHVPKFAPAGLVEEEGGSSAVVFAPGRASGIGIGLRPRQIVRAKLRFAIPEKAKPGEHLDLDVVQRAENGRIKGGITVRIEVQAQPARNRRRKAAIGKSRRKRSVA